MDAEDIYNQALGQYYSSEPSSNKQNILDQFETSAEMGLDLAMLRAGEMYFFGDGIKASKTKGVNWIAKACKTADHYNDLYVYNPNTGDKVPAKMFLMGMN